MRIAAKPYVPGSAIGRLAYWWQNRNDLSDAIVVLRNVTPGEMLDLVSRRPAGVVVVGPRRFSHTLIHLFSRAVPAVMVGATDAPLEGDWCYLDGGTGWLECSKMPLGLPAAASEVPPVTVATELQPGGVVRTLDGHEVFLEASISDADGARRAHLAGAAAIGLVRSEFTGFLGAAPPSQGEYVRIVKSVLDAADDLLVSWRLLDVGAEKVFPWMRVSAAIRDSLGVRGCRAYQIPRVRSVVHSQLRAILSADTAGRCSLLVPYVSSPEEFEEVRSDLVNESGVRGFRLGAMLETAAACLQADQLCQVADFVAIGTNDLAQSFFGASRSCSDVERYIEPYSPALVRFFSMVAGLRPSSTGAIRICGQLPLIPHVLEYLVGLGFRKFSVEPLVLSGLAQRCSAIHAGRMRAAADKAASQATSDAALRCLESVATAP